MKIFYFILSMYLFFTSCSDVLRTTQEFKTQSLSVRMNSDNKYKYEDSLVIINYDFWSSGGEVNFTIYNKSNFPIYINWKNSNFIFNGFNNEYWSDIVVTNTNSKTHIVGNKYSNTKSSVTVNQTNPYIITNSDYKSVMLADEITNTVTVSKRDNPSIQIPPKSFNQFEKFSINMPLILIHDTLKYENFKEELLVSFIKNYQRNYIKENTILFFRNYIAISKEKDFNKQIFIDNDFWISSINCQVEKNPKSPPFIKRNPSGFYLVHEKKYNNKNIKFEFYRSKNGHFFSLGDTITINLPYNKSGFVNVKSVDGPQIQKSGKIKAIIEKIYIDYNYSIATPSFLVREIITNYKDYLYIEEALQNEEIKY